MKYRLLIVVFTALSYPIAAQPPDDIAFPTSAKLHTSHRGIRQFSMEYILQNRNKPVNQNWNVVRVGAGYSFEKITLHWQSAYGQMLGNGVHYFQHFSLRNQLDGYIALSYRTTLALSYGHGWQSIFPRHTALAELYYDVDDDWRLSGGYKLIDWKRTVSAFTLSCAKEFDGWLAMNLRGWLLVSRVKPKFACTVGVQKDIYQGITHVGIDLIYGIPPDDLVLLPTFDEVYRYQNSGVSLYAQQVVGERLILSMGVIFRREEYAPGDSRRTVGGRLRAMYIF